MKNRGIFYALIIILGTSIGKAVAPLAYMGWEEVERAIWPPEPFNIDLEGIDWNGSDALFNADGWPARLDTTKVQHKYVGCECGTIQGVPTCALNVSLGAELVLTDSGFVRIWDLWEAGVIDAQPDWTSFQDLWEEDIADGDTTLGVPVWMPGDLMMAPYSTSADYWVGPDSPTVASSRSNGFEYVILAVLFVLFVQSRRGKEEDEQGSTEN